MGLNVEFCGVRFDTMTNSQKKRFYDDFFEAINGFIGRPAVAGIEDKMKIALKGFYEKYNLIDENIQFVWR
jgi:hypothetical protein